MVISILVDDDFESSVETAWLEAVAGQILLAQEVSPHSELDLFITGQERIQALNRDFLGEDAPTDVLSFPMLPEAGATEKANDGIPSFVTPPDGIIRLGEVIISYPQVEIQAKEHRHPVKKEVTILLIHGILHLLGYDHDEPAREAEMTGRETELLHLIEEKTLV